MTTDILKSDFLKERKGGEKVPHRRRRLPKEAIKLIKSEKSSYTKIQEKIRKRWGLEIAKSTVSYYKRQRHRIKPIDLEAIPQEDWQWFQGLFSADGSKTISKDKYGRHYIVRISLSKEHDLPIARKCMQILKAIGLSPTTITEGNCLRVKASSKSLFSTLSKSPPKRDYQRLTSQEPSTATDG